MKANANNSLICRVRRLRSRDPRPHRCHLRLRQDALARGGRVRQRRGARHGPPQDRADRRGRRRGPRDPDRAQLQQDLRLLRLRSLGEKTGVQRFREKVAVNLCFKDLPDFE